MARVFVIVILLASTALAGVYIPDPGLKAAIEEAIGRPDPSAEDMLLLTDLSAGSRQIRDLTGIEYASNLRSLYLAFNHITDLKPLSGLYNLRELDLSRNEITDIGPLSGLTGLENLDLDYNRINDLRPLKDLSNLYRLDLDSNLIEDLSALAGLVGLEELWLCSNRIVDLGPLALLSNLKRLDLESNMIVDLSPIAGLGDLQELWLGMNRIVDISPLSGLVCLRRLDLRSNLIEDVSGLSGLTNLEILDISGNQISNIGTLSVLSGLWYLSIANNRISDIGPLCGLAGGLSVLDLADNPLDDTACQVYIPKMLSINPNLTIRGNPCDTRVLVQISAGRGGHVTSPGEGTFSFGRGEVILVEAVCEDGFRFSHWSGSVGGNDNPLFLRLQEDCQIKANFVSLHDRLFVDDDARDYLRQDGTVNYPLASIQDALEVAANGATILVRPGRYVGPIDLLGKSVRLVGGEPNDPFLSDWPVITTESGPAVRFAHGEGRDCRVMGFIITGCAGNPAAAIWCSASSPVISHCLIVGNGLSSTSRSIILCQASTAQFIHCTITENVVGATGSCVYLVDSQVLISHCIVWGNVGRVIGVEGSSRPEVRYTDITGLWEGVGNLSADPLFARAGRWVEGEGGVIWEWGDYHLRSGGGRWDAEVGVWQVDEVTSPCIDAGDPGIGVGYELEPNGGRVNLGAYGGTTQASRSL
ncbi:MAG: leucine-rich repeat domain-containing protein [Sedimentisphaerales bacterium]|nr:leucine-rich repeat domain-containing protein [Sedimentisphaerales bacterium]